MKMVILGVLAVGVMLVGAPRCDAQLFANLSGQSATFQVGSASFSFSPNQGIQIAVGDKTLRIVRTGDDNSGTMTVTSATGSVSTDYIASANGPIFANQQAGDDVIAAFYASLTPQERGAVGRLRGSSRVSFIKFRVRQTGRRPV
jgi:hypothetical protein